MCLVIWGELLTNQPKLVQIYLLQGDIFKFVLVTVSVVACLIIYESSLHGTLLDSEMYKVLNSIKNLRDV